MDDSRFDDIIKRKISDYEEPAFDASALASLHDKMHSMHFSSWHLRHRTELITGSAIIVSTLIILSALWFFSQSQKQALEKSIALQEMQQQEINKLHYELDFLKRAKQDTIYMSPLNTETVRINRLIHRIETLESMLRGIESDWADDVRSRHYITRSGNAERDYPAVLGTRTLIPRDIPIESSNVMAPQVTRTTVDEAKFSVKTLRTLERHYRHGVGIRLGPTMEVSRGAYDAGAGRLDISGGLLGDFILSPSLSLEVGAKFHKRFYEISEGEILSSGIQLPKVNEDLTPVVSADVDSWVLEIPVNVKYRYPLSLKKHVLIGAGYSSLTYTKQIFEYDYNMDSNQSVRLNESHSFDASRIYPGTINLSMGLSSQLKNKKIVETSLYYQYGLGRVGIESMKSNFVGIRGIYWFNVR